MAKTAESLCKNVSGAIRDQALTLAGAIIAMQKKIEKEIPTFEKMPMATMVTSTQGEKVLKSNPASQEFRAIVRDYASALKNFDDLLENHRVESADKVSTLEDIRSRIKVCK